MVEPTPNDRRGIRIVTAIWAILIFGGLAVMIALPLAGR